MPTDVPSASPVGAATCLQPASKLNSLTGLRFTLAVLIAYEHCGPVFGLREHGGYAKFAPCVSAFFMLSGFVLRYRYQGLQRNGLGRYYVARFARIWPTHMATLGLTLLLVPAALLPAASLSPFGWLTNLSLTQVWFPSFTVVTSLNATSWSISTELFFYLCFPLLLWGWLGSWPWRVGLTLLAPLGLIALSTYFQTLGPSEISVGTILSTHPGARLWEFALGMAVADIWLRLHSRILLSRSMATMLEAAAVLFAVTTALSNEQVATYLHDHVAATHGFSTWLVHAGLTAVPIALLLLILALGRGHLSLVLSTSAGILLGEVSYSLYLVHYPLIKWVSSQPAFFAQVDLTVAAVLFTVLTAAITYLIWAVIEVPCRRGILCSWDLWWPSSKLEAIPNLDPRSEVTRRKRQVAPLPLPTWRRVATAATVVAGVGAWMYLQVPSIASLDRLHRVEGQAKGSVDAIAGIGVPALGPMILDHVELTSDYEPVEGWAATAALSMVRGVYVTLDDGAPVRASYGSSRQDVADYFKCQQCIRTGYVGYIPTDRLKLGTHELSVHIVLKDNKSVETIRIVRLVVQ